MTLSLLHFILQVRSRATANDNGLLRFHTFSLNVHRNLSISPANMPGGKSVSFAHAHMGPGGQSSSETAKTGTSPPKHKPTARSLEQFQDILAKTSEDFKKMRVRNEEELARDAVTNVGNLDALKKTLHEGMRMGGQKTGLALTEMLLAEFKAAVDGEVAARNVTNESAAIAGSNAPATPDCFVCCEESHRRAELEGISLAFKRREK
ncbi:phytanoyl-dioxygenase [Diplodia corticola]|uniref:Phytanoyl-dioxygenase n=1 Tax=Diplodia corticola TaxID=236234 RepID=A0A1J9S3N4_9PEZI|nr:phytanoyl-dioxygenase [Diplodia corticola]OJD34237.1 phytanoyl-dioxygenase [Diplodia corticola]